MDQRVTSRSVDPRLCRVLDRVFTTRLAERKIATLRDTLHWMDREDILQADGETVKKVTINEPSISLTVKTRP